MVKGSEVVWHIQQRLRAAGHNIAVDGDLGPKTFWDNSETLRAVLKQLGGPIPLAPIPAPVKSSTGKRVFIDIGHGNKPGGYDPGAVHSAKGPVEHELNKIGAEALAAALKARGIEAKVSDANLDNYQAGAAAKGYDILVSYHHNAAAGAAQYALVLYGEKNTTATDRSLSTLVSARIAKALGIPDKGGRAAALSVLSGARAAGVPTAILVEPFFIHKQVPDNPSAFEMTNEWAPKAGAAIADAIADHLGV